MQRSPNLRNYRQFSLVKAPLATFDTIDLGDDDATLHSHGSTFPHARSGGSSVPAFHSPAITGQSHASRSQHPPTVPENGELSKCDEGQETEQQPVSSADTERCGHDPVETAVKSVSAPQEGKAPSADSTKAADESRDSEPGPSAERRSVPRIGSLKGSYIKKQDSSSSSSSSDSEDEAVVSSKPKTKGRARQFRKRELREGECKSKFSEIDEAKDTVKNLTLEYLDPKSITSPSKRKAYEKRIQRLQVKTSPIARPRSTAPINVHTLDEYVGINSPDKSPRTPSGEKLKITLPSDEFSVRSPRKGGASADSDEEAPYFEFDEELLFSRTQYALVVDETGKLPSSPRKVLIPPTLSPATSRKVTPAEDLQLESGPGTPKLLFYKSASPQPESQDAAAPQESTSVTSSEESNWANFSASTSDSAPGDSSVTECQNWADFPAEEEAAAAAGSGGGVEEDVLTVKIGPAAGQRCNIELLLTSSSGPNSSSASPATPDSTVFEPTQSEQCEPTQSEQSKPTQSEQTEPSQSEQTEPSQSEQSKPTQSEPTQSEQPKPTLSKQPEPSQSEQVEPSQSEQLELGKTEKSEPGQSEQLVPRQSEQLEPRQSEQLESWLSGQLEPSRSGQLEPSRSEQFEPSPSKQELEKEGPETGDQGASSGVTPAPAPAPAETCPTDLLIDFGDCAPITSFAATIAPSTFLSDLAATEASAVETSVLEPFRSEASTVGSTTAGLDANSLGRAESKPSADLDFLGLETVEAQSTTSSTTCDAPDEGSPQLPPQLDA